MRHTVSIALTCLVFSACASNNNDRGTWENLDYKSVYNRAQNRESDPYYTPPSTVGCLDDDLSSCGR